MEDIVNKLNDWLGDRSNIRGYKANYWTKRQEVTGDVHGQLVCFDPWSTVSARYTAGIKKCDRQGIMEQGAQIHDDVVKSYPSGGLDSLQWSEELAYSAGKFVEEFEGCPIYPQTVVDHTHEHKYLREVVDDF